MSAIIYGIAVTVMLRFGLLCVSVMMFVVNSVALALCSFKLSLGGRELLSVKT